MYVESVDIDEVVLDTEAFEMFLKMLAQENVPHIVLRSHPTSTAHEGRRYILAAGFPVIRETITVKEV